NPQWIGAYNSSLKANSVTVSGAYAYVTEHGQGGHLAIIYISSPAHPRWIGAYNSDFDLQDDNGPTARISITVSGAYAYVTESGQGGRLEIIDVRNPASPKRVGNYMTSASAQNVTVSGDYAFVSEFEVPGRVIGGLEIIDVKNPASPQRVGNVVGFD